MKLFFTSFIFIEFFQASQAENKLIMANIIFRNGHTDPGNVNNNIPEMLTRSGMVSAHNLGDILKERFRNKNLITSKNEGIAPHNVYAISSEKMPCYQTCQLVTASLLAPKGTPREWNKWLDWTPFKMYLERKSDDLILTDYSDYRDKLKELIIFRRKLGNVVSVLSYKSEFLQFLQNKLRYKVDENNIWTTFNTLETAFYASKLKENTFLNIQKWLKKDTFDTYLGIIEVIKFIVFNGNDEMFVRSFGGKLLYSITQNMIRSNKHYKKQPLYLYSGDEMTLLKFTTALNIDQCFNATFLSGFSLELYEDNKKQKLVELYFFDGTNLNTAFHLLEIKECPYPCKLKTFIKNYKKRSIPHKMGIKHIKIRIGRKIMISAIFFTFVGLLVYSISMTRLCLRERNLGLFQ